MASLSTGKNKSVLIEHRIFITERNKFCQAISICKK